ncbi:hypothetical protein [Aminobacter sp. MET-1]|uniref:hypothetical protein n=1 Tax=Aminobacter sp. MET-1 TaxID=2951085 RepID=UPI00226AFD00|nr:hypothetical protein [Aminobacter sp. MET-1]MCX8568567.1 hypothetical protein [Aminobacter sp. MET-1]
MTEKMSRRIFVFWPGANPMSDNRMRCLETMGSSECDIILVDRSELPKWVLQDHPLHPAFQYLSPIHQSDYLRAYFMHFHGGGYSDIKRTTASWAESLERMEADGSLGVGYAELRDGVALVNKSHIDGVYYYLGRRSFYIFNKIAYLHLRRNHAQLIGNCAFAFRPRTEFTEQWLDIVERRLDALLPHLIQNPARHPKERRGVDYGDGPSRYPLAWSFLLGDVLAPLSYRYRSRLGRHLPPPDFRDYE